MRHKSVVLLCSLFFIQLAYGADNVQLSLLYRADQAARQKENVNWNLLKSKDEERRIAVLLQAVLCNSDGIQEPFTKRWHAQGRLYGHA